MKTKLILFISTLLIVSCNLFEDRKKSNNTKTNDTEAFKKISIKNDTIHNTIEPTHNESKGEEKEDVLDFMFSFEITFHKNEKKIDFEIPIFFNNPKFPYTFEQYPQEYTLSEISNKIDTLHVVIGKSDCVSCLDFIALFHKNKQLYYAYKNQNTTIVENGNLNEILAKREISMAQLYHGELIDTNKEYATNEYLNNTINAKYITSTDLKLIKLPDIYTVKTQIDKTKHKQPYTLSFLDSLYKKQLNKPNILALDNLLSNERENTFFHSGVITKKIKSDVLLFIESFNIYYINSNNNIYKIKWTDGTLYLDQENNLLDDSTVELLDNQYVITDWYGNNKTNLFDPKMQSGKYLVIYQLKPKYRDTYIYSYIDSITYSKPKKIVEKPIIIKEDTAHIKI